MKNKSFIVVAMILVVVAVIANKPYKFDLSESVKVTDFPKTIGGWEGADMALSERDYEILETKNLFVRDYKNKNGDSVYLYIIYAGDNRRALHPPEVCYTGGGATITEKSVIPITASITANKFTIEEKNSRQLVVYWFKSTNLNTYNFLKQQLKIVTDRMLGRKTSGALIRVSTEIKDGREAGALELIRSFCGQIEPLLAKYVP